MSPATALPIEIDKNSSVPIYYQLQRGLTHLIEVGTLKPGDGLPSENEFAQRYAISPMTVRQAMTELVRRGYIRRERGRGTFVTARPLEHPLDRLVGFSEDMKARQMQAGSQVLLLEYTHAPQAVIDEIGLYKETRLLRLKRVRLANGQPVGIHDSYLHQVDFTLADLERTQSLYALLAERGIVLADGIDLLEAVAANREAAHLLNIKPGAPLLRTTRFSWDTRGQWVEYVVALYRADLYQYRIRLRRDG